MGVINKTTEQINSLLDKVEGMPEEGVVGKTPVLETGTTTTLPAGSNATSQVVANGTDASGNPKYKLNFGIPKGQDGTSSGGGGVADSVQWNNVLNKPTWVNSSTKPAYTATEVGALPATTTIPSKTSQLTNDSNFTTTSSFKTVNGQSIVGSGNIEISGTGSGIADAPSDGKTYGRKNGAWASIENVGGSVDITDILNRLVELMEVQGTCTDEDYNALKGYADNGVVTFINLEGNAMPINIVNISNNIQLIYESNELDSLVKTLVNISESKEISVGNNLFYSKNAYGSGQLGSYTKPSAYSAITPDDSISTAIGKLEAGIGSGGSSDGIYYLPTAVLTLDAQATKEEIEAAFGGLDKKTELINAIKAGKKIYIQGDKKYSSVHVTAHNFFDIQAYITFIRKITTVSSEIVEIGFANNSTIKVIEIGGYQVNGKVNLLTSSSTTDEISLALGGISGIQKLKKAIQDGNSIYTTFYSDSSTEITSSRFNLSVVITSDDSKYEITICGVQGESFLQVLNIGYLYIEYDVASNTFTCERYNNTGIS